MSSNQYLSSMNVLFERLQQLGNISNSKEIVQSCIREFKFLGIFLDLQSFIDVEPNMLDVTQKVHTLVQDASVHSSESQFADYFDFCTFNVKYKIRLIKMEIRAKYSFPKISSLPLISAKKDGIVIPKFVMDFMDTVVDILRDVVDDACSLLLYLQETKKHIADVLKELKLLRTFVCFVSERFVEHQNQHLANFFTHVLAVTGHASMLVWLYFSSHGYENQYVSVQGEIKVFLFLQIMFKPIQPSIRKIYIALLEALKSTIQSGGWRANIQNYMHAADTEANFLETIQHDLEELQTNSNSSRSVALKDHLATLNEMLDFFRANIIHVRIRAIEVLLRDIDTLIIDVGLVVYSSYKGEEEEKEVMALGEVIPSQVLDLRGNIQQIITTEKLTPFRKAFQSNYFPKIHGLGYVDFLLNNLKELQSRHSDSLDSITKLLQRIQKELDSWQPFLESVAEEQHNDINKIQRCATQLIGKAYAIEYLIDACIYKKAPVWCFEGWLSYIMEETTLVKDEVAEIHKKKMVEEATNTVTPHMTSTLERSPRMNEEIVGFDDVMENLRRKLLQGNKGRDVISIVGMPGLGKTTLAYRLYSDSSVVSHFDIRAECYVSQVYSRKDLLLAILRDVTPKNSKGREKRADELADELRKALFSKRYLILLDDVWEARVLDDLMGCFQDANNGSRIILTTRNHEIAEYARFQSNPLSLRMFNDEESWKLLRKKVFGDKSCPPLLMNIGRQIAEKCGQLPLSVALVAGVLAEVEKKEECWEQVANNLVPQIHNDSRAIIENSYKILPYHLRSCFLYFGAFLEDSVIYVSKLIRLWISEGFIKSCEGKNLEDIAEGYLANLIGRNLVMGTKRSSRGKIKACRIHDLLHDFCKVKAKEENLVRWMKWDQNASSSSDVSCREQLAHRTSIYGKWYRIGEWSTCWSHVGSIILHNDCLAFDIVSQNFYSFKFLKVLDLLSTTIDSFPTDLVYLRYFAARTHNSLDKLIISNCWNLETLILQNYGVMSLPLTIWNMVNLRHLHISICSFNINHAEYSLGRFKSLYDLRSFSTVYFSCIEDAELILRKTPNLRELRCTFLDEDDGRDHYYVLNFPTEIETLKICWPFMFQIMTIPFCISAPNLKNLTLERYCLHPQHLSKIALLQNLQVLKMKSIKFEEKVWKVSDGDFPELKVLKLHEIVGFEEWDVADDEAFPKLEGLVLRECAYLEEIPSSFGEISSLKYIEVKNCEQSLYASATVIRDTQVDLNQNSGFQLFMDKAKNNNRY